MLGSIEIDARNYIRDNYWNNLREYIRIGVSRIQWTQRRPIHRHSSNLPQRLPTLSKYFFSKLHPQQNQRASQEKLRFSASTCTMTWLIDNKTHGATSTKLVSVCFFFSFDYDVYSCLCFYQTILWLELKLFPHLFLANRNNHIQFVLISYFNCWKGYWLLTLGWQPQKDLKKNIPHATLTAINILHMQQMPLPRVCNLFVNFITIRNWFIFPIKLDFLIFINSHIGNLIHLTSFYVKISTYNCW